MTRRPAWLMTLSTCSSGVLLLLLGCAAAGSGSAPPALGATLGGTFYVATTGNDATGIGTLAQPWATIGKALTQVPDGATILVAPGTYNGAVRLDGLFATGVTVRSQPPYQAKLRNNGTVVKCFYGQGITLDGFDIAHDGPGAGGLVVQIQDLLGEPGIEPRVSRIVVQNNVIHNSYNNDLLKVNNGCSEITVRGNLFYNQQGSDEHIDVNSVTNVVIEGNIFGNDFAGSGRTNNNDTSSYIVIKDSNGTDDANIGCHNITVRGNLFSNWQGSTGSNFVLVGEDGNPYFEGEDILIENNLLLGNSPEVMRAPLGVKGGKNITYRNNTIVGDLPSLAFAMRLNSEGANPANENIQFFNNVFSDPTGTMGAENPSRPNDFSDTPPGETASFTLSHNLYWNGVAVVPTDAGETVNYTNDPYAYVTDPRLPDVSGFIFPRWQPGSGTFAGGYRTIESAFRQLVYRYGTPASTSYLVDRADASHAPAIDILGHPRPAGKADLGAIEVVPYGPNNPPVGRVIPSSG